MEQLHILKQFCIFSLHRPASLFCCAVPHIRLHRPEEICAEPATTRPFLFVTVWLNGSWRHVPILITSVKPQTMPQILTDDTVSVHIRTLASVSTWTACGDTGTLTSVSLRPCLHTLVRPDINHALETSLDCNIKQDVDDEYVTVLCRCWRMSSVKLYSGTSALVSLVPATHPADYRDICHYVSFTVRYSSHCWERNGQK